MTCLPARPRSSAAAWRRRAHEIGKPGEVVLAVEHERVALLVRQHVLAEGRAEGGEAFVDVAEPRFRSGVERGARTLVHRVVAIEHARLLRRQAELRRAGDKARRSAGTGPRP